MAKKATTKKTTTRKTTTKKTAAKKATAKKAPAKTRRAEAKAVHAADQENARLRDERAAAKDGATASERAMARSKAKKKNPALAATERARKAAIAEIDKNMAGGKAPPAKKRGTKPKANKAAKNIRPKRVSLLDAAATVLAGAKEPMAAKAIVEQVMAKGLWASPGGKTPHATLYAAMIREISKKGKDARFEKVDRGQFRIRKGA